MRKISFIFIGFILMQTVAVKIYAQSVNKNLDSYYQALNRDHEMNGNVAASENGKVIYQRSFGFKDMAAEKVNDSNSQFELASVSKLFTALAVLQLKDRGLVDLDAPLQHYFQEFPYPKITIRHLLSHTSGLPDTEALVDSLIAKNPAKQFTIHDDLQNVIVYSKGHTLKFQPGEQWSYSSAGYHLLGLLVEKISGQTLAAYTRDHIFKIAGMNHSYIQTAMKQKEEPNRTKNYQYSNHFEVKLQWVDTLSDWKEWTYNLALETGGGGIISNARDLLRFDAALSAGKLLKQKTLEEAYTPYQLNNGQPAQPFDITYCGLGWFIFKDTSHGKVVWGSGANPGTISFIASNIDRHQCLVVLHNIKCNPFNDLKAVGILNGQKVTYHAPLAFVYAQDLYKNGREYADSRLKKLYPDTANYMLTESELDRAALEFRRVGLKEHAVTTCETHIRLFPESSDAFKNYGLTLAEYGQKEKAIAAYKKAIELNPNDTESKDALKKLTGD
jgi:CubicO group peptidase (beta-lactamase class C family)